MNHKIVSKITSGVLLCTILAYTMPVLAYTKEETIYSKVDTNGKQYETIVTTHLQNEEKEKVLKDISDLLNIKNISGDETFSQDGNTVVWNADGEDIYYQGESKEELPVTFEISYTLDGKEIEAKDLAGKSGKVVIKIEYTNHETHKVTVNGKQDTLYTPFVVVCGTVIENDKARNIEINSGKIIDDGSKSIIMGLSLPGMQESLDISKDTLEIPSTIEISMDVTDFELGNIITYMTPKIIEESDVELFDNLDEIYSKVSELQTASNKLVDGSKTLKKGAETYTEKSQEFNSAMKQIANGTGTIASSYNQIDEGISGVNSGSSSLQVGAEKLNSGIGELSSNLKDLPQGVTKLYEGSNKLYEGISSKNGLVSGVNSLENKLTDTTTEAITKLSENIATLKTEIGKLEEEEKEITNQITTLTELKQNLSTEDDKVILKNTIDKLTARKTNISSRKSSLNTQINENLAKINKLTPTEESKKQLKALNDGLNAISDGTEELKDNLAVLNEVAKQLPSAMKQISDGSKELSDGSKKLSEGAASLNKGSKALKTGIQSLNTNTQKLTEANNQLTDGASTISEGVSTLAEGISQFNQEGIGTICNYINGDVKDITTRLEKLQELSDKYNHFTMSEDGVDGSAKFIVMIDSIKKEEENKQEAIIDNSVNEQQNKEEAENK